MEITMKSMGNRRKTLRGPPDLAEVRWHGQKTENKGEMTMMKHLFKKIRDGGNGTLKTLLAGALILLAICLPAQSVFAVGTPAGSFIDNQATATYTIGASTFIEPSNITRTTVAEIIDITVTWQDIADVTVSSGGTNEVLTFQVTNTGNGNEDFALTTNAPGTPDFGPTLVGIYADTNGNGSYDAGPDLAITDTPVLAADASVIVFVLNDIPGGQSDTDRGECELTAASNTPTFATPWSPGDMESNGGDGGTIDAVLGTTAGNGSISGFYIVSNISIDIDKFVDTILDPFGTAQPVPGAVITYRFEVTATGPGTATGVVVTDEIPTNTTYVANTLEYDFTGPITSLTDAGGDDAGDVGATTAGYVTVSLGNMDNSTGPYTITFDVTID